MQLFYVGVGAFIGTFLRASLSYIIPHNQGFPIATFCVNIIGSIILAIYLTSNFSTNFKLKLFLATGLLGSFTTFSSFSYETITLIQNNEVFIAFLYVSSSIGLSLVICTTIYFKMKGKKPI